MLRASDSIGSSLELCCPRHKDTPIQVSGPDDFPRVSPELVCWLACLWHLPDCGHMCQARCHLESMHNAFRAHSRANAFMNPVSMHVRNKLVKMIVKSVISN